VTAIFLIVAEVIPYKPGEMPFAKDDDVLEELSTAAADPALGGSVLPWTAVGDPNGLGAHGLDELDHRDAENRVAVEDEVSRRRIVRGRVPQLLNDPRRCRMKSGVEVQDAAATVLDDKEAVKQSERYRRNREQIHRGDFVLVIT